MRRLLLESGLDKDLFQVMVGGGDLARDLLAKSLDGVFFTGSHRTGQKIAQQLAASMTPMVMELGGKDPAYVMADADVEKTAAALVDGAFYNAGQSCCSVERIYVNENIYENFLESFVTETCKLTVGNPLDKDTYMGPLARKEQLKFIDQQCSDALKKEQLSLSEGVMKERGTFIGLEFLQM